MTSPQSKIDADIPSLVANLAVANPAQRERARKALVQIGTHEVTAALVGELSDPRDHLRWEAAKALISIGDPVAAPALLEALDDGNEDVRWLAAEGLIALDKVALLAVLAALIKKAGSGWFCKSAHHVLHELAKKGYGETLAPVLAALEHFEPAIHVPPAAYKALVALKVWPAVE